MAHPSPPAVLADGPADNQILLTTSRIFWTSFILIVAVTKVIGRPLRFP
jgi:hypothetical protein